MARDRIKEYYRADATSDPQDPSILPGRTEGEWTRDGAEAMFFTDGEKARRMAQALPIGSRAQEIKTGAVFLWVIARNAWNFRVYKRYPGIVSGGCELIPVATFETQGSVGEYLARADFGSHAGGVEFTVMREKAYMKQAATVAGETA